MAALFPEKSSFSDVTVVKTYHISVPKLEIRQEYDQEISQKGML